MRSLVLRNPTFSYLIAYQKIYIKPQGQLKIRKSPISPSSISPIDRLVPPTRSRRLHPNFPLRRAIPCQDSFGLGPSCLMNSLTFSNINSEWQSRLSRGHGSVYSSFRFDCLVALFDSLSTHRTLFQFLSTIMGLGVLEDHRLEQVPGEYAFRSFDNELHGNWGFDRYL